MNNCDPAMDLTDAIAHCLSQPHATEETPFGPEVLVYKVGEKMFALTDPGDFPPTMNLKCDPDRALDLRDRHASIRPGYHMNKRHWNTVTLDGSLPATLVHELIEHSYQLVVQGLPKKVREALGRE
jgi:predicted DNA-binding protein (MmcQ/YjbR family)